jgi:hypothetical protein
MVFAGTQCGSFADAEDALSELASLSMRAKRIWRATQCAGEQQLAEQRQMVQAYEALPLPARQQSPIVDVPEVACVMMDGGRFQRRDRCATETIAVGPKTTCWREMKVGCLTSMTSDATVEDPCPELPATFVDPGRMREISQEIKGFSSDKALCEALDASLVEEALADEDSPTRGSAERAGRPLVVRKSVVASAADVTAFGPLLAASAYERGFHAAPRKCFVADGSETNWGVWRKYFSHYTPIVDFVHALMYVYAAAMAGASSAAGWERYRQWAQWLWRGELDALLAALAARQQELGAPATRETGTPRAQVAESLGYLTNQRGRMKYDEYRRQGLPITSTLVESTIKQINRRVKGTEKFWANGIEPMLALVARHLSPDSAPNSQPA